MNATRPINIAFGSFVNSAWLFFCLFLSAFYSRLFLLVKRRYSVVSYAPNLYAISSMSRRDRGLAEYRNFINTRDHAKEMVCAGRPSFVVRRFTRRRAVRVPKIIGISCRSRGTRLWKR